jgi:surface antigen
MRGPTFLIASACALGCASPAWANSAELPAASGSAPSQAELTPYLQCVPYARDRSGVQIFGDARTWWDQAAGRYKRGNQPLPGAVMAFRPSGNMVLGHVAAVARVIDNRTVLLDHANWSPIGGRRGQIERGVKAVDVSPANDWSQVRVWYDPLQGLGTTAWPVAGFIYNQRDDGAPFGGRRVLATGAHPATAIPAAISPNPSRRFAQAFAGLEEPSGAGRGQGARTPRETKRPQVQRVAAAAEMRPRDAVSAAVARYER